MFGIDVSHHNGNIDWNKVKPHIDFVILKLGNSGDNKKFWLDDKFETYYNQCKNVGIPIGVYVYSYTNNIENAKQAGQAVTEYLKSKSLELPVYIDMEDNEIKAEGKQKLTELVIAFNTEIEKAGYWAGVYANRDWFDNYLNKDEIKKRYTTWIATYTLGKDKYKGEYDMWQNSSTGHIDGIIGNVDTNYLYRDLIAEIGKSESSKPQKSIDELANEVIAGKWGNGEERKRKLGELYNDVQKKVNEMLSIPKYYKKCDTKYKSIVDALNSIGINSSFDNRKKIAIKNNINNYSGTAIQNNQLLEKLKAGILIRA